MALSRDPRAGVARLPRRRRFGRSIGDAGRLVRRRIFAVAEMAGKWPMSRIRMGVLRNLCRISPRSVQKAPRTGAVEFPSRREMQSGKRDRFAQERLGLGRQGRLMAGGDNLRVRSSRQDSNLELASAVHGNGGCIRVCATAFEGCCNTWTALCGKVLQTAVTATKTLEHINSTVPTPDDTESRTEPLPTGALVRAAPWFDIG